MSLSIDHDRGLIDHRALGESADHAEGADLGAIAVAPAEAAVELLALGDARTFGAQVVQTLAAPAANAAGRNEGEHDVIASFDRGDLGADILDHAGRLVAKHHRPHRDPALAAHNVIVGAAQPDRGDAHQHFGRHGRVEGNALDRQRRSDLAKHGGQSVHGS